MRETRESTGIAHNARVVVSGYVAVILPLSFTRTREEHAAHPSVAATQKETGN
jgi:hypothetical protein